MKIQKNYNLSKLNTFGISVHAKFFVEIHNESDVKELFNTLEFKNNNKLFLGGGSNVLFTKDFDGLVILNKLKGIALTSREVGVPTDSMGQNSVYIRAMGGEMWHDLVIFAVERGYWGIENLSLIPGTVGAAPMQNIGAYGAELKDIFLNVETFEIKTGEKRIFTREECKFGYRDSIFKNKLKGEYFISAITLELSKIAKPNLSYKILSEFLKENDVKINGPKDISDAVSNIRKSKLPDPAVIMNAGSFFKNVFLSEEELEQLLVKYPDMPSFKEEDKLKIPAGWLIEKCGWKGKRIGNVGVHGKQALVLVNYGGAKGEELLNLAKEIVADVKEKFNLELIPEVNLI